MSVITHWDSEVNHAMTFVGYNDSIRYDFNNDGKYTNNKDINGDGILDMRDWEIGGLIMVNSWGTSWGDFGKAFVPYKLLAEPSTNGGISTGIVHVIRAKASYKPQVVLYLSLTHTSRNKLRITAGVSSDPNASRPDHILQLPLFNFQGGDMFMKGGASESDKTIEIGLDITPLLSYINSGQNARFFLVVEEKDPVGQSFGTINSFKLTDYVNGTSDNWLNGPVAIENNDTTFIGINKSITFNKVGISTTTLPDAVSGFPYSFNMEAENGTPPYTWNFVIDYLQKEGTKEYIPLINNKLTPDNNDDGIAVLTLPFRFPFYDKSYSQVRVSTDGSILFGDNFEYVRDISALKSFKAVTVYGSDLMLYPEEGDGIWYYSSRDSITVRWKTSKYDEASFNTDFGVTLFPSGQIKFNYGKGITASSDWVAGVSNGDGISYCSAKISGSISIPSNSMISFTPSGFPEGLMIDKNGLLSFMPRQGNKDWYVTAMVTDQNKISSGKTFSLHSSESVAMTPGTIEFNSQTNPDPWLTGKDLTISNVCNQAVILDKLDWEGLGWKISNSELTFPYTLYPGTSLSLNVRLKASLVKSSNMISDTLNVRTNYVTYPVEIRVNPSIYTNSVYPVTFSIRDDNGPVAGAVITIDMLTNSITTNSEGSASVLLPNGNFNYYISFTGHYPQSGIFTVNNASQMVNLLLTTVGIREENTTVFGIFPNPFSDELIIRGLEEESQIKVSGILGNTIIERKTSGTEERINTSSFPSGIYIITVDNKDGHRIIRKAVKR